MAQGDRAAMDVEAIAIDPELVQANSQLDQRRRFTEAVIAGVSAGVIGLDDPVTRWRPDFRPRLPDGGEATILIRQLLTHTSGLGYRFFQPVGSAYDVADISDGLDLPGRSLEDNLARIASVPLLAAPGTAFIYSVSTDTHFTHKAWHDASETIRKIHDGAIGDITYAKAYPTKLNVALPGAGTPTHLALQMLEKKLTKARDSKHEQTFKQLENLKEKLYPGGSLQERHDNLLSIQANNPDFIPALVDAFDPLEFKFTILEEE